MKRDSWATPKAKERTDTGCYTKFAYQINCRLLDNGRGADSIAYGLSQTSFLQLRSDSDLSNFEAVRFIRELARKQKSTALVQLAMRMASALHSGTGADPFAKVKVLMSDMIEQLENEAESDGRYFATTNCLKQSQSRPIKYTKLASFRRRSRKTVIMKC